MAVFSVLIACVLWFPNILCVPVRLIKQMYADNCSYSTFSSIDCELSHEHRNSVAFHGDW